MSSFDFKKKTVMVNADGAKVLAENALDYHNYVARGFRVSDEPLPEGVDEKPEAETKDEDKPSGTSSVPATTGTGGAAKGDGKADAKAADAKK